MYANAFGLLVLTALLTAGHRTYIYGRHAFAIVSVFAEFHDGICRGGAARPLNFRLAESLPNNGCHPERSETESKDLRTIDTALHMFGAKILRLAYGSLRMTGLFDTRFG